MKKFFQKLGGSLMLPIAVLPAAALLLGIGYAIDPAGWGGGSPLAAFLIKSGAAIIDNLPILFAVGVATGMSKEKDGASALSGLVAYLIVTTLLSTGSVAMLKGIDPAKVALAFGKISNAFIGIISGIVASVCYNRFYKTQLPQAFAFFSGKRLAPIMSAVAMLFVSGILFFVWPAVYGGLVLFGESIIGLGACGAGIYAFFNRLLIPTGLHHALNSVFWFDVAGINDIGKFWGTVEGGVKGVTGIYQAGFFPVMMFGLPAAAFAMYKCAKPEKKKQTASIMLAAAVTAFVTGVTEPIEFAFMFVAPGLYIVHAALTGVFVFLAAQFKWIAGFSFSGGLIDYCLSFNTPMANQPYMLLILGLVAAAVYYFLFMFLIKKFNIKTPGREDDDISDEEMHMTLSNNNFTEVAQVILEGLGGKANIVSVDNCATRLRLEVKDTTIINDKKVKSSGAAGIIKPGKTTAQVIVGTQVQFVADALKDLLKK